MPRRILLAAALCCASGCKHTPDDVDIQRAQNARELGVNSLGRGEYRPALEELLKAEKLDPDNPDTQYALGLTYFAGFGRLPEAEAHLRKAVAGREKFSDAENALGNVLLARGECDKAIPLFEHAMSNLLWATPYMAQMNLGWCLHKVGRTEDGLRELKAAVNTHPPLCGGYDYLARIYTERGADADAMHWMEKYLQVCDTENLRRFLQPGQLAGMFFRLGMAQLKTGDRDQARTSFATCVERFGQEQAGAECRKNLALME